MKHLRSALLLLAWLAGLSVLIVGLGQMGNGTLAMPLATTSAWRDWLSTTDPVTGVFAIARVGATAVAWYLVVTTVLSYVAQMLRWGLAIRLADAITVPAVRRLTRHAAGLSLAGLLVSPSPALATADSMEVPLLRHMPAPSALTVPPPATEPSSPTTTIPTDLTADTASQAPRWTVSAGDSLWHIARLTLLESTGHAPEKIELADYWRQLIELNRASFPDPANPNLIHPGNVLKLPPIPTV